MQNSIFEQMKEVEKFIFDKIEPAIRKVYESRVGNIDIDKNGGDMEFSISTKNSKVYDGKITINLLNDYYGIYLSDNYMEFDIEYDVTFQQLSRFVMNLDSLIPYKYITYNNKTGEDHNSIPIEIELDDKYETIMESLESLLEVLDYISNQKSDNKEAIDKLEGTDNYLFNIRTIIQLATNYFKEKRNVVVDNKEILNGDVFVKSFINDDNMMKLCIIIKELKDIEILFTIYSNRKISLTCRSTTEDRVLSFEIDDSYKEIYNQLHDIKIISPLIRYILKTIEYIYINSNINKDTLVEMTYDKIDHFERLLYKTLSPLLLYIDINKISMKPDLKYNDINISIIDKEFDFINNTRMVSLSISIDNKLLSLFFKFTVYGIYISKFKPIMFSIRSSSNNNSIYDIIEYSYNIYDTDKISSDFNEEFLSYYMDILKIVIESYCNIDENDEFNLIKLLLN